MELDLTFDKIMKTDSKVSIITACKNRVNALKVSIASWIQYDEIKEIIIVDWSSDEPINYLTELDPRIKVVRVEGEEYFNQPQPLNLAASIATGEYIFKLDGDHMFNPYDNGIADYLPNDNEFFCGQVETKNSIQKWSEERQTAYIDASQNLLDYKEYVTSYSPFYRYLVGMLMIKKEHFHKIGGYNEKLGDCYAFEDDEICQRLELFGLKKKKYSVNSRSFIHLPHGDNKRLENFKGFKGQEKFASFVQDALSAKCSGDVLKWQVEYAVSEKQTSMNKQMIGNIVRYRVENNTRWKISKSDDQNYFAVKNNKDYKMCTIRYTSLQESSDRRRFLQKSLDSYGIKYKTYISNRYHESDDKFSGKYLDSLNDGTKGCAASHLKMIKDWYENTDEDYGFFAEDDLSLDTLNYWAFTWEEFLNHTPEDAECIQLLTIRDKYKTYTLRHREWDDWGATAYIITRNYAKKIIDAYIKGDTFHLEVPNSDIQPLVENLIFSLGVVYTVPLFVENVSFSSTFENRDDDVKDGGKNNHVIAANKVLQWWVNGGKEVEEHVVEKEPIVEKIAEEKTYLEKILTEYSLDTENPEFNYNMGEYYYDNGHTAPALSYFLRCAERAETKDPELAYLALIMGSNCYFKQGTRDQSGRGLLWQAQMFLPERPEAYFLLARYAEKQEWWQDCYSTSELALRQCDFSQEPLKRFVEYPGKWGFLLEKAISGWWWGKVSESRELLHKILDDYSHELSEENRNVVIKNLKKVGVKYKEKKKTETKSSTLSKKPFSYPKNFDWGTLTYEDIITIEREVVHEKVYRFWEDVKDGDVVLDIGASVGAYAVSILENNPKKVYCVEPSKKLMSILKSNCDTENIIPINWGIVEQEGDSINIFGGKDQEFKGITFKNMLERYSINHVDYMKVDCEGGEYNIFRDENMEFLLNKVKFMAIEIHLNYSGCREKFKNFRDKYLTQFKNYKVMSCTRQQIKWGHSLNIKDHIFNDDFIDNYTCEYMIYIKN